MSSVVRLVGPMLGLWLFCLLPKQLHASVVPYSCNHLARDLLVSLPANSWTEFECACCVKFCGQKCPSSLYSCQLGPGKCRLVSTPSTSQFPLISIVIVVLVFVVWVLSILLFAFAAKQSEMRVIKQEIYLGRRLSRLEKSELIEYSALLWGGLFFLISIWPFIHAVRYGRRKAREQVKRQQVSQKALSTHLGEFSMDEFVFRVQGPTQVINAKDIIKEKRLQESRPHTSSSTSMSSEEEFWLPVEESIVDLAMRGLSRVRGASLDAENDLEAKKSINRQMMLQVAVEPEFVPETAENPSSPTRLLVKVPRRMSKHLVSSHQVHDESQQASNPAAKQEDRRRGSSVFDSRMVVSVDSFDDPDFDLL